MVLDYLKGGHIFQKLRRRGTYSEKDACLIMEQLLLCANFFHEKGIVHRDLKPDNILLSEKDSDIDIKIADFGLAALMKNSRDY